MASIRTRVRADGTASWQVIFRRNGRSSPQDFATFTDYGLAVTFKKQVDRYGGDAAVSMLEVQESGVRMLTVQAWCLEYVDLLTGVTEGTRVRYRQVANAGLGRLADIPIQTLSRKAVAGWINELAASGLASKTIANKHGFLYAAMERAIEDGLATSNPCKKTRLPETAHAEMVFLTDSEFAVFINYVRPDARDFVTALVGTGHRFGEETALQVRDWDAGNRRISISRSWKYSGTTSKPILGAPKTGRSHRSHTVSNDVAEIYSRLCADRGPNEFIHTNSKGDPWRAANFHSSVWQPAVTYVNGQDYEVKRAGWERGRAAVHDGPRKPWRTPAKSPLGKRPRVHDMRHTYASWMLQAGMPITAVSRRLGHESIKTTVDTYGHLSPAEDAAMDEAMNLALSAAYPQIEGEALPASDVIELMPSATAGVTPGPFL